MTDAVDKIGIVRHHRWIGTAEQHKRLLECGCRAVVELGGKSNPVTHADLVRMATEGRTFVLVHAFLLADPRRKKMKGGLRADFDAMVDKLTARGAAVKDLEIGLTTADKRHRQAITAVAHSHISRSNRGLRSALNGARSKGRPEAQFTREQMKDARAIWRNIKDYPSWEAAQAAFDKDVDGFTTARAFRLWKGRT